MKILKLIVGILAALFAVMHVVTIFTQGMPTGGSYASGYWMGKIAGIAIGAAIAIVCLRPSNA